MNITINNFGLTYSCDYLYGLCYPLAQQANIKKDIVIDFYDYLDTIAGSCSFQRDPVHICVFIDKKNTYPYSYSNQPTRKTIGRFMIQSEKDLIRMIVAHELCHATYGHRDNFKLPMGGVDLHGMELYCDSFALAATGIKN